VRLTALQIQNYKSLRDVTFAPAAFSVLVGRNASGKSNFADALDFLGLVYAYGLEHAVARKGGYENIAHRKERRSKSAISFRFFLEHETTLSAFGPIFRAALQPGQRPTDRMRAEFEHSFAFRASGEGIRAEFRIVTETVRLTATYYPKDGAAVTEKVELSRDESGKITLLTDRESFLSALSLYLASTLRLQDLSEILAPPTESLLTLPLLRPRFVGLFTNWLTHIAAVQVSPDASRHPGVPTPNPTLSVRGENLPAVIDWLQGKHPDAWRAVSTAMREIVPELEDITVSYLHTRTLGLFFKEQGVGRPWSTEEVSDGTIRSLAMLVACFDPRITVLVLEEPENSLHPWIIKAVIEQVRKLAKQKMVIVTTHSPVVLNAVHPTDVWVIYKSKGETNLQPIAQFDPQLISDWEQGRYRLFDYLESGAIVEAVPSVSE